MPLFGIGTMDPIFKVDLEPFYSCSSSSYLKDYLQWGSQGLVAPLLMGRMSAAGQSLLPLFTLFLCSFFSVCPSCHFCHLFTFPLRFLVYSFPFNLPLVSVSFIYIFFYFHFFLSIPQLFLFLHYHIFCYLIQRISQLESSQ